VAVGKGHEDPKRAIGEGWRTRTLEKLYVGGGSIYPLWKFFRKSWAKSKGRKSKGEKGFVNDGSALHVKGGERRC